MGLKGHHCVLKVLSWIMLKSDQDGIERMFCRGGCMSDLSKLKSDQAGIERKVSEKKDTFLNFC